MTVTTKRLGDLIVEDAARAKPRHGLKVYSVTKHRGFVPSLEYFNKQVFSRDLGAYTVVERGDFAYSTIHLDEGAIGIAPERCLISPMYTTFRLNDRSVVPEYLLRYLKSQQALAQYSRMGKGSVERRKSIALSRLGTMEVPLLATGEQARAVSVLDRAEELRAKRRNAVRLLDDLAMAVFLDMFGEAGGRSKQWPQATVAELLEIPLRNGVSPASKGQTENRVLTLSAITGRSYLPSAWKVAKFLGVPPRDVRVEAEDFLVCRGSGSLELVGRGRFPTVASPDTVFPDTMIAVRIRRHLMLPRFLELLWNSAHVRRQLERGARTTNGTYKINQTLVEGVALSVPPMALQESLVVRLTAIERLAVLAAEACNASETLLASLQHRAFRGEL